MNEHQQPHSVHNLSTALQQGLGRYMSQRREQVPNQWKKLANFSTCLQIQARHFIGDLIRNPINTLWAIPYLSIRKTLEVFDKLGLEISGSVLPLVPGAFKTEFQKEIERRIQVDLFGLSENPEEKSALVQEMEKDETLKALLIQPEWKQVLSDAEADIRKSIADFCTNHNGFTDLAASTGIVYVAHRFFRDSSLDIFGIGKHWAAKWSREHAVSHFFFGRKLGNVFYKFVPPPAPSSKQIYLATLWSLGILSLFSTLVTVLSYPVQSKVGLQKKQIQRLLQSIEDKLLLRFTKNLKDYQVSDTSMPTDRFRPAQSTPLPTRVVAYPELQP